jgi:hypothetical protein
LAWAWRQLLADNSGTAPDPNTASEDEITEDLQRRLNESHRGTPIVSRFAGSLLETIQRGGNYKNYAGTALNRQPDLTFRLVAMPSGVFNKTDWGLFVECKIIDGRHPVGRYVSNGVRRFVRGDYAWAMSTGLMLAYVRSKTTRAEALMPRLVRKRYRTSSGPAPRPEPVSDDGVHVSIHLRPLVHPPSAQPLGDIELAHLWLSVWAPIGASREGDERAAPTTAPLAQD